MKKFSQINEMEEYDEVTFTKIQKDALRLLKESSKNVVSELKKKWFDTDQDDFTWLEEKYLEKTLQDLSEILARKVKS